MYGEDSTQTEVHLLGSEFVGERCRMKRGGSVALIFSRASDRFAAQRGNRGPSTTATSAQDDTKNGDANLEFLRAARGQLFVEGVFEFAVGVTDCQDWAGGFLYYSLCYAAHQDVGEAGAAVSA